MLGTKKGKLFGFLNQPIKCNLGDDEALVGTFLSFDRHMNMVLSNAERVKQSVRTNEEGERVQVERKQPLGLVFVRGETVTAVTAEKKKKKKKKKKVADIEAAPPAASRKRDRDAAGMEDMPPPPPPPGMR